MLHKKWVKVILDILMTFLLILMFNQHVISLQFHEIGGLAVCFLFLFHKLLNWKWILGVSQRLFDPCLPGRTRFLYLVDFLLLLAVAAILVSGILISKILFPDFASGGQWKIIHYFSSALSLVLVGIHLGLHSAFLRGLQSKFPRIPAALGKPLKAIALVLLLVFGAYSIGTSSFLGWLTLPFAAGSAQSYGPNDHRSEAPFLAAQNLPLVQDALAKSTSTVDSLTQRSDQGGSGSQGGGQGPGRQNGQGLHQGQGNGQGPQSENFSFLSLLDVLAAYGSIISFFAVITAFLDHRLRNRTA